MYEYKALVTKVYDGDTITVDIELGFGVFLHKQSLRLAYINTPEVRGAEKPEGIISRDRVRELILGKEVIIKTKKDDTCS
jgi:micrococcal nuclease